MPGSVLESSRSPGGRGEWMKVLRCEQHLGLRPGRQSRERGRAQGPAGAGQGGQRWPGAGAQQVPEVGQPGNQDRCCGPRASQVAGAPLERWGAAVGGESSAGPVGSIGGVLWPRCGRGTGVRTSRRVGAVRSNNRKRAERRRGSGGGHI